MVLTVADTQDMSAHLDAELARMREHRAPDAILACDCILWRIEAERGQATHAVSRVLAANRVTCFSTYGEQHNSIHVNHTLTGVAIYPPSGMTKDDAVTD